MGSLNQHHLLFEMAHASDAVDDMHWLIDWYLVLGDGLHCSDVDV